MSYIIEEVLQEELSGAKIKVIGVGGGGGNMINHMIQNGVQDIEMIVANTDAQVLERSLCPNRIQLGAKLTKGLGAGMVPEIGKESAIENAEEIREYLDGADIVFIAAGLGGGTGTGASPVIAQIAREAGALTISVVTKPFMFEGGKRDKLARAGLEELKKESDSIVVIPNDKLLSIVDKGLGLKESFKIVDEVLARAVTGTSGIILASGDQDINLDFADLRTVMSYRGLALMGMGQAEGEKSAYEAIKNAIESPLLDDVSIHGAMGILVHFNIHPNYPLIELTSAMEVVKENADSDATIIMGTTTDETLPEDFVKITLIATGFEKAEEEKKKITTKESDGTNLNIMQRRIQKPEASQQPASKGQQPSAQPKPQQPQVDEKPQFQPQQQSQAQTNQFQQPAQPEFEEQPAHSYQQQGGFGSQSSFGSQRPQARPQNFGQQQHNGFGNSFGGNQHSRSQGFGQQSGFGDAPKRPSYTKQDKNQHISEEYLDVPTWLRQRGNK
jgi:cell division protein FtsZ